METISWSSIYFQIIFLEVPSFFSQCRSTLARFGIRNQIGKRQIFKTKRFRIFDLKRNLSRAFNYIIYYHAVDNH